MPLLTLTWVTMGDAAVCPICQNIEGYVWVFNGEPMPNELTHPTYGTVWNVQQGSEAHGAHDGSCRCRMQHQFDFTLLRDLVKTKVYEPIMAKYMREEVPQV